MNKPQLFLLHFAGGSVYSFQFMMPYLAGFHCIPIELPGRGKRAKEYLLKDFNLAVGDIYQQIMRQLEPGPFLIYGHSMGAILALQVESLLERSDRYADAIIVSGNAGPGTWDGKKRYLMEKDSFRAELKEIGGMPAEVLEDNDLLEYFLPMLKADFEVVEKNVYPPGRRIKAPVYAIMGTQEDQSKMIQNWKNYTESYFEYALMEGNHFFIYEHAEQVADVIKQCYMKKNQY